MNGDSCILDTNILIDYFQGVDVAARCMKQLVAAVPDIHVSEITEMELLSWPRIKPDHELQIERFLDTVNIQRINGEIKRYTIALRRKTRRKLPDSIVAATAVYLRAPLVTNDRALIATRFSGLQIITINDILTDGFID